MTREERAVIDAAIKWAAHVKAAFGLHENVTLTPALNELFLAVLVLEASS